MPALGAIASLLNNVALAPNTESILGTTPLVEGIRDSQLMVVLVSTRIVIGTGATSVTLRVRRGATLNDANVGFYTTVTVTPGATTLFTFMIPEILQGAAGVIYSVTYTAIGESAGSTVGGGNMVVWAVG